MSALTSQRLIALVFLTLGGWALFAPASVIELAITPEYQDSTYLTAFTMACFGSQAVLFGVMALVVEWPPRAFLVFAAALLPFFWFNYHFHYVEPVLTSIGMLDFAGNVTMLLLALLGWRAAKHAE
ncbi:hypothetical protein QWY75_06250 [Pontixanthobacter aestiaquae]|uniref:DoxX-like family protein n=1 Tax=Pontixanthobacter aestiaquae TaxID=1509367 RepID=A0A844Z6S3_9SPHN|nr:hypothetical protein [Pontixanthobacter aestiaquae]MDN3645801.1 hypothetical protein [Pontixanthobacter aestiaquae]MXO83204.1 hypothetical protein [Pontixanthobacter aestiaquae]